MYRHDFFDSCFSHDKTRTNQANIRMIHEKINFHLKNFQEKNIHSNCYRKNPENSVSINGYLPFAVWSILCSRTVTLPVYACMRISVLVAMFFGYAMSFVHYFAWFSCDKNDMSCEW